MWRSGEGGKDRGFLRKKTPKTEIVGTIATRILQRCMWDFYCRQGDICRDDDGGCKTSFDVNIDAGVNSEYDCDSYSNDIVADDNVDCNAATW